jgi:hypothetical protein
MKRSFKRDRGYLTFAQQGRVDYLRLAYALALSLKASQSGVSHLSVVVTPCTEIPERYREVFDEVIDVPWLDEAKNSSWKLENEWKAYHCTPYEHTVKLDADMLFPSDVSDWWSILGTQDVVLCTDARSYTGRRVSSDAYRKCFTANNLPDVYSAFTSFRWSETAQEVFTMAEYIFQNWERFFEEFLEPVTRPRYVSTDVVFALAIKLLDLVADCTLPASIGYPRIIHMKSKLQGWPEEGLTEDWTRHIPTTLTDDLTLKIAREVQVLPLHYHDKAFLTDRIITSYERHLGIA